MRYFRLKFSFITFLALLLPFIMTSCGSKDEQPKKQASDDTSELTAFELENGIGPIKEKLQLGTVENALVKKGEGLFNTKCSSCHKLDERYTGPAQRNVLDRRSPEYIMNMMLNPDEMLKRHPEAKKMFAEYLTPMTNQNLTMDEARAILEYFRAVKDQKK